MNTIEQAFWEAVLADIVYVDGFAAGMSGNALSDLIKYRVSEPLAKLIGARFEVLAVKSDPTSDYQGVVFRDMSAGQNGQLYLANRGTESGTDIFNADVDLALVSGVATRQTAAMVDWWLQISRPAGTAVPQIAASASQNFVALPTVSATGELSAALAAHGAKVRVVGHSLGGHLTSVFASLFYDQVAHSSTFNGAGLFSTGAALNFSTWIVDFMSGAPLTLAASLIGSTVHLPGSNQDNFYAENGLSLTTNSSTFTQLGNRIGLFNERSTVFGTDVPNHFMYKLTDVLAVMTALEKLDPATEIGTLNALFEASSIAMKDSDENLLDGLRRILLGSGVRPTPAIDDGGDWKSSIMPTERTQYHQNLADLQNNTAFPALIGKVTLALPNTSLVTSARTDFAAFLTLLTGSPVALKTVAGQEDAVAAALGPVWSNVGGVNVYADWQADQTLTPEQRAAGQGHYTDQYLADRAAMLSAVMEANLADTGSGLALRVDTLDTTTRYFKDEASGLSVQEINELTGDGSGPEFLFGSTAPDTLTGHAQSDHLYGLAGDDTLDGAGGNDWLEGGSGADRLSGGEGTDLLLGGTGDDILIGGHGADTLFGGAGEDRYVVAVGDGWDTLTDSDGAGRIELGTFLVGDDAGPIEFKSPNVWQQTISGRSYWYILTDWTEGGETFRRLAIAGPDGEGVFVNRWANGQLGITLPDAPPLVDPVANTVAEETYTARVSGIPDVLYTWYVLRNGNQVITAGAEPILTERWWNAIDGVTGNNLLTGSPGNDLLLSGHGNSVLNGHGGQDFLAVLDGNSRLYAGDASDLATALAQAAAAQATGQPGSVFLTRTGDNTLVGSAGNDLMLLGTGDNVVVMGPGDNLLVTGVLGNVPNNVTTLGWSVRPVDGNPLNLDIDWGDIEVDGSGPLLVQGASGQVLIPGYEGNAAYHQFLSHPDEVRIHAPGAGDNLIHTGSGDSTLLLGNGNNRVFGSTGRTTVLGGTGIDTVVGGSGALEVNGRGGDDSLIGGSADDLLLGGGGADTVEGGAGNDHLEGDSSRTALAAQGNDVLDGGAGNDTLFGQGGDDTLLGGSGEDRAYGGEGDDTLDGGAGADVLDGGAGDDTYVFRPGDSLPNAQRVADTVYDDAGTNRLLLDFAQSADLRVSVQDGDEEDGLINFSRRRVSIKLAIYEKSGWRVAA